MSKRKLSDDFEYFKKKFKKFEKQLNQSRKGRIRVIDSSSSSPCSSREPSPPPRDPQDGGNGSVLSMEDMHASDDLTCLLECSTPPNHTVDDTAKDTLPAEDNLDTIVLDILGDDPSATVEYGPDIHKDLATRLEYIATHGLAAAQKKELLAKYKIPANCAGIAAPLLNTEIKAALTEGLVRRDKSYEIRQKQLATAISSLASVVSEQLSSTTINQELLRKLMDTVRLLCDIQSTDTRTRRNFALFSVKKDMKDHLSQTKVDKYLFGENLSDVLKSAKAVNKSITDLKVPAKPLKKPTPTHNPKTATKNWKPQAPVRRPPGPARGREPAPRRTQPATSSKQSSPPPRTTRQR